MAGYDVILLDSPRANFTCASITGVVDSAGHVLIPAGLGDSSVHALQATLFLISHALSKHGSRVGDHPLGEMIEVQWT